MMTMRWLLVVLVMVAAVTYAAAGRRWKKKMMGMRGCRRGGGQNALEQGNGERFLWALSGQGPEGTNVPYEEGAFAPEGSSVVVKYPLNARSWVPGLKPAKMMYDFSNSSSPVIAFRHGGRRGRASCIIIDAEVDGVFTYGELIGALRERNRETSPVHVSDDDMAYLVAEATDDDSSFSQATRDFCSRDRCGREISPVYYYTYEEEETEDDVDDDDAVAVVNDEDDDDEENTAPASLQLALFNRQATISGLPDRRQQRLERRRQRQQRRQQQAAAAGGRQERRQNRQQRRQQRRQRRLERRRQRQGGVEGRVEVE